MRSCTIGKYQHTIPSHFICGVFFYYNLEDCPCAILSPAFEARYLFWSRFDVIIISQIVFRYSLFYHSDSSKTSKKKDWSARWNWIRSAAGLTRLFQLLRHFWKTTPVSSGKPLSDWLFAVLCGRDSLAPLTLRPVFFFETIKQRWLIRTANEIYRSRYTLPSSTPPSLLIFRKRFPHKTCSCSWICFFTES